jgi:hypothetical protein
LIKYKLWYYIYKINLPKIKRFFYKNKL